MLYSKFDEWVETIIAIVGFTILTHAGVLMIVLSESTSFIALATSLIFVGYYNLVFHLTGSWYTSIFGKLNKIYFCQILLIALTCVIVSTIPSDSTIFGIYTTLMMISAAVAMVMINYEHKFSYIKNDCLDMLADLWSKFWDGIIVTSWKKYNGAEKAIKLLENVPYVFWLMMFGFGIAGMQVETAPSTDLIIPIILFLVSFFFIRKTIEEEKFLMTLAILAILMVFSAVPLARESDNFVMFISFLWVLYFFANKLGFKNCFGISFLLIIFIAIVRQEILADAIIVWFGAFATTMLLMLYTAIARMDDKAI